VAGAASSRVDEKRQDAATTCPIHSGLLAKETADELEMALEQFQTIAGKLGKG
jgi:hypothetical protein